ncbi:acetyl-CoA C-acetyltransferase [Natronospira proteinivora]|uniref:Acetyl-CoA C-acetyltransferase n=1 Tax=Natronospira proteinivora TaxID=1807133 RepID=A0ABT1GA37_9GAMM|nr:acetyl-CoA C-acetyltransferase [Natronospira proteinivora]MCP1728188.1 acetyl-CoA C-acetyltransferase [Natronospira proteinivora]
MSEKAMRRVAILGGNRIPFCRVGTHYKKASNQDMATAALQGLVERCNIKGERLGDVSLGAVTKHSRDWNLARESVLGTDLNPETPGFDLTRACGTSLEAANLIGNKIATGQIEAGIAAGTDTASDVPVTVNEGFRDVLMQARFARSGGERFKALLKLRPRHLKPSFPGVSEPRTGMGMGQHCELMAQEWELTQSEQDELALASHKKAAKAWEEGFFDGLVTPFRNADKDNNVRPDSSLEKMATLKPAFDRKSGKGTLTAANSTPLTDGAAAVLLGSEEWAKEKGLTPMAYLKDVESAAVDFVQGEGLLMAPAFAVPRLLKRNGLSLQDFDYYEIHEAFAAQVLCTLKAWESEDFCRNKLGLDKAMGSIDRDKLNVKGGSVALGHPFAATGARVLASAAKLLEEKGSGRVLISVCTAGGMGVTAIVER